MSFFSSLDGRKEAKEDQGVRDAGQIGRVPLGLSFTQQTPQPNSRLTMRWLKRMKN